MCAQTSIRHRYSRVRSGLYRHASGDYIVRTDEWEGPKGGKRSQWEIGYYDDAGNLCVGNDHRFFRRLADAVLALDKSGPS